MNVALSDAADIESAMQYCITELKIDSKLWASYNNLFALSGKLLMISSPSCKCVKYIKYVKK